MRLGERVEKRPRPAVHIMSQLYTAAIREHPPLVVVNPFDHLELPRIEPRPVEFLEHDEAEALYEAAEALGAQWRTLTELDAYRAAGVEFEMHRDGIIAVARDRSAFHWFDDTFAELARSSRD